MQKLRLEETRGMTSERKYLKTCYIYLAGWRREDISGLDECCMGINEGTGESSVLMWVQPMVKMKTWASWCKFFWQQPEIAFLRSAVLYISACSGTLVLWSITQDTLENSVAHEELQSNAEWAVWRVLLLQWDFYRGSTCKYNSKQGLRVKREEWSQSLCCE